MLDSAKPTVALTLLYCLLCIAGTNAQLGGLLLGGSSSSGGGGGESSSGNSGGSSSSGGIGALNLVGGDSSSSSSSATTSSLSFSSFSAPPPPPPLFGGSGDGSGNSGGSSSGGGSSSSLGSSSGSNSGGSGGFVVKDDEAAKKSGTTDSALLTTTYSTPSPTFSVAGIGTHDGSGQADPILGGFDGTTFNFMGEDGKYYNFITDTVGDDPQFQMAVRLRTAHPGAESELHIGTFIDGVGIHFRKGRFTMSTLGPDRLNVTWNGEELNMDKNGRDYVIQRVWRFPTGKMTMHWAKYRPGIGNSIVIRTDFLLFSFKLVPSEPLSDGTMSQPYINFNTTMLSPPAGTLSGVMGETYADGLASPDEEVVKKTLARLQAQPHPFSRDSSYEMKGFFDDEDRPSSSKTETRAERSTLELPFADFFFPRKGLAKKAGPSAEVPTGLTAGVGGAGAVPQRGTFAVPLIASAGVIQRPQVPVPQEVPQPAPFSRATALVAGAAPYDFPEPVPIWGSPSDLASANPADPARAATFVRGFEDAPADIDYGAETDEGSSEDESGFDEAEIPFGQSIPRALAMALSAPTLLFREVSTVFREPCHHMHIRILPSVYSGASAVSTTGDDEGEDEDWGNDRSFPDNSITNEDGSGGLQFLSSSAFWWAGSRASDYGPAPKRTRHAPLAVGGQGALGHRCGDDQHEGNDCGFAQPRGGS
eukprot:jgi/Botrbrau1/13253/Bobra.0074s0002.1